MKRGMCGDATEHFYLIIAVFLPFEAARGQTCVAMDIVPVAIIIITCCCYLLYVSWHQKRWRKIQMVAQSKVRFFVNRDAHHSLTYEQQTHICNAHVHFMAAVSIVNRTLLDALLHELYSTWTFNCPTRPVNISWEQIKRTNSHTYFLPLGLFYVLFLMRHNIHSKYGF